MERELIEVQVGQDLEIKTSSMYGLDIVKISTFLSDRKLKGATKFDITEHSSGFGGNTEAITIYTYYEREETDEEFEARKRKENERQQNHRQYVEDRERKEYERLKKKYE